ncbi:MAG: hypothetical protein LUH21_26735 [Clostridiales bacterium]|nr:hypothetical protein [Clostridiales bacterium]
MRAGKIIAGMVTAVCMAMLIMLQQETGVLGAEAQRDMAGAATASNSSSSGAATASNSSGQQKKEKREEIISIDVPWFYESGSSPFDFILDPQGLICRTEAVRYGGKSFEEGATLFFRNTAGDYDYSHQSDWIEVISRSSVPVRVTVEASFEEELPSVCLALVDDRGNEITLDKDESATLDMVLDASEEGDVQAYSFGLTGECRADGSWKEADGNPRVIVTWSIEPLTKGKETAAAEEGI